MLYMLHILFLATYFLTYRMTSFNHSYLGPAVEIRWKETYETDKDEKNFY